MKVEQVIGELRNDGYIDEQEIYVYASAYDLLDGKIKGLVLLSVAANTLYIHHANLDNSYGNKLAEIPIPEMQNIRGKAGLFGGKFSFVYKGDGYVFKLPSKAGKFVGFFC